MDSQESGESNTTTGIDQKSSNRDWWIQPEKHWTPKENLRWTLTASCTTQIQLLSPVLRISRTIINILKEKKNTWRCFHSSSKRNVQYSQSILWPLVIPLNMKAIEFIQQATAYSYSLSKGQNWHSTPLSIFHPGFPSLLSSMWVSLGYLPVGVTQNLTPKR